MSGTVVLALQLAASAPTSDAPLKRAQAAQERFEMTRRAHLPWMRSTGSRECDAIVGRYCYWYDSTETKPVPEPARVVASRKSLLSLLDSLAAAAPDNDWIAGQLVRYTIEGGDSAAALRAARACRPARWWCAALEGLTHHVAGRYEEANAAFDVALTTMPAAQRCEWMDPRREVAASMAREFRSGSCVERAQKAELLWKLSQPLWGTAGNDLRSEHFARLTMALLLDGSANAHGMRWGSDSRELLLRYGWAEWFNRAEPALYQAAPGGVTGHDREPSYFFFPTTRSVASAITDSSWAFRRASMPSRYAPRHIEWMGDLAHQLARFPRGDSMRIVAMALPRDSALSADSATLTLGALQEGMWRLSQSPGSVAAIALPNDTALVSVEMYGPGTQRAERARYTVAPLACVRSCLSDLLLFEGESEPGLPLDSALGRAIPGASVKAANILGLYWELQAPASRDSIRWASVTVEPMRISFARRAAARLRVAHTPSAVKLRWQLRLTPSGSVGLRLPPNARGRYRVKLTIDGVGSSERVVLVQ